jgi:hypothetical protein
MFSQAVAAPDTRLRHIAAEVLNRRSPALAVQLVGPLLSDEDRETRQLAANLVLKILAGGAANQPGNRVFFSTASGLSASPNSVKPTSAQIAAWHQALLRHADGTPDLTQAAAIFVTGNGKTDVGVLLAALGPVAASRESAASSEPGDPYPENDLLAFQAVMPRLSLPACQPVLDKLLRSPVRFAQAARQCKQCQLEVEDYLLDPARFKSAVEPASGGVLSDVLELLAGFDYQYGEAPGWTLWSETVHAKAVAQALLNSTNAAWRAAAVCSLGMHTDAWQDSATFEKAAHDSNPWVRAAAARALARSLKGRALREQHLAPLLADTNRVVASTAAVALLEPETRQLAGLDQELNEFQFESFQGGRRQSTSQEDDRPVTVLESKPGFLPAAQKWLATTSGRESTPFALLLAQYGDFTGVDRLVAEMAPSQADDDLSELYPVLAGIALSHDAKYVTALKQLAAAHNQDWTLRKILQALKGMSGPDARQLRLDINEQIRNHGNPAM